MKRSIRNLCEIELGWSNTYFEMNAKKYALYFPPIIDLGTYLLVFLNH